MSYILPYSYTLTERRSLQQLLIKILLYFVTIISHLPALVIWTKITLCPLILDPVYILISETITLTKWNHLTNWLMLIKYHPWSRGWGQSHQNDIGTIETRKIEVDIGEVINNVHSNPGYYFERQSKSFYYSSKICVFLILFLDIPLPINCRFFHISLTRTTIYPLSKFLFLNSFNLLIYLHSVWHCLS